MGPLSYMWFLVDLNNFMWHVTVKCFGQANTVMSISAQGTQENNSDRGLRDALKYFYSVHTHIEKP